MNFVIIFLILFFMFVLVFFIFALLIGFFSLGSKKILYGKNAITKVNVTEVEYPFSDGDYKFRDTIKEVDVKYSIKRVEVNPLYTSDVVKNFNDVISKINLSAFSFFGGLYSRGVLSEYHLKDFKISPLKMKFILKDNTVRFQVHSEVVSSPPVKAGNKKVENKVDYKPFFDRDVGSTLFLVTYENGLKGLGFSSFDEEGTFWILSFDASSVEEGNYIFDEFLTTTKLLKNE